ncbi:Dyp-type peroxidase [Microseira wollei]|uniref:Peroxidase n=1 Tax=Microseira wollei NIES-4236 TaxID=2530354 RepID=A0AAV3X2W0_9CYAN|nr:Dyp-type peroxidase [Microseira wollei]GET35491.1 peroxidase [Microseira wollei NIES-4236]
MNHLELQDIQGIIARGYGNLEAATYLLLHIQDAPLTRQWLGNLADSIQTCQEPPRNRCLNAAFSYEGLVALGLHQSSLCTFPTEFQEGMTEPNRSRHLGDREGSPNDPKLWLWGGSVPQQTKVHLLLLLYASDEQQLAEFYKTLADQFSQGGVDLIQKLDTKPLKDEGGCFREHFGFRDAISQPIIEGLNRVGESYNTIKAGEFILGYANEYNLLTESPRVKPEYDRHHILPSGEFGYPDLGRNGSYLVFRQLSQNVEEFWRFLDKATQDPNGSSNPEARLKLAAKMVGRWPSGTSLVQSPDQDDPTVIDQNAFAYHHLDTQGFRCPIGSHIRRSNPRDSLGPAPGTEQSIAVNKTHRLLRRGRTYGEPISSSFDPEAILNTPTSGERGIHFICINANISRQFEFVQHTWINSPKFSGLYEEIDPLVGDRNLFGTNVDTFTQPANPIRHRTYELPQFVVVRGGAYFFLPAIKAIRYLASFI